MPGNDLTQERLKEVLDYDPETGVWSWKIQMSNRVRAGDVAGCDHPSGRTSYRIIRIDRTNYESHRLAWLWVTGNMPSGDVEIDHIDHNGLNNKWSNLRLVSTRGNAQNRRRNKANTSGIMGVHWDTVSQKWRASIKFKGKSFNLGNFSDKNAAAEARKAAEKRYGFHPLHGS